MWPEFSVLLRRDNGSFNKSAPRSGNTVFIKGFDTSSGEDQVILCFVIIAFLFSGTMSLYICHFFFARSEALLKNILAHVERLFGFQFQRITKLVHRKGLLAFHISILYA